MKHPEYCTPVFKVKKPNGNSYFKNSKTQNVNLKYSLVKWPVITLILQCNSL